MPKNCGYDEKDGEYLTRFNDHIAYRYEILSDLGKGSFGKVVKCLDHQRKEHVGIKIIKNERRFHK